MFRIDCLVFESPTRALQKGDDDTADIQYLSTVGRQSSPGSFDVLALLLFPLTHHLLPFSTHRGHLGRDDGYTDLDTGGLNNLTLDTLDGACA